MSDYQVIVTPSVLKAMEDTFVYLRGTLKMPAVAEKTYNNIAESIMGLSSFPKRRRCVDWEPMRSIGIRRLNVGRYAIFYVVNDEQQQVQVFSLLYGTTDVEERLRRAFDDAESLNSI